LGFRKVTGMADEAKPLLQALSGQAVWPPPLWLMRQAGRYLPEYRALRAQVPDFIALCTSPELATEVTLQPIRRFGFDAAILFSDILMLPRALGRELEFREGEGPVLPPLRAAAEVAALDLSRLPEAIVPIEQTVRQVRLALASEGFTSAALIGFAGAPFTVACYMVEGGGSRDFLTTRTMAYRDPYVFSCLIDRLTEATIAYLAAQIDAGAEAVMLFDTWAGILPPSQFRTYVERPTREIVAALRNNHPDVPIIGFPRLAGMLLGEYVAETKVQTIGMDTATDPAEAMRRVPSTVTLQGNLDPLAVVAGGAVMRDATNEILRAVRGRPFVFNLGHGIVPQTPPEHVTELVRLVRAG
jgi:uroporphyrinogen decarboxylase